MFAYFCVCVAMCFFVWLPVVNLAALLFIFSIWLILSRECGSQTVQPYRRIGLTYVLYVALGLGGGCASIKIPLK